MDDQTLTMETGGLNRPQRVVEFELRRPHREDIKVPGIDLEPVRKAIEDVALTGIGLAIITSRSVTRTLEAAHRAGLEAADKPGPFTRAVLGILGHKAPAVAPLTRRNISVLPISDYDALSSDEVIARLATLGKDELAAIRAYELEHERRTAILQAIDGLETTAS